MSGVRARRAGDLRPLGRTGLEVSLLGFGGAPLGNLYAACSDQEARATVEAAWAAGIRYYDTAPFYGYGLSERRLGAVLREQPRARYVISTKVGRLLQPVTARTLEQSAFVDPPPLRPALDYGRDGVLRSHQASLERLGLDRVDLLLVHDLAPRNLGSRERYLHHLGELERGGFAALRELREGGAVAGIGVGLGSWEACQELCERFDFDVVLLAGRYTLLEQGALESFLPLCQRRGIAVVVGGPFNSGILATGSGVAAPAPRYEYRHAPTEILERVAELEAVCAAHGTTLAAAALDFPLHHPAVASVVAGARSPLEVHQNCESLSRPVPPGLYASLRNQGLLDRGAPVPVG